MCLRELQSVKLVFPKSKSELCCMPGEEEEEWERVKEAETETEMGRKREDEAKEGEEKSGR